MAEIVRICSRYIRVFIKLENLLRLCHLYAAPHNAEEICYVRYSHQDCVITIKAYFITLVFDVKLNTDAFKVSKSILMMTEICLLYIDFKNVVVVLNQTYVMFM